MLRSSVCITVFCCLLASGHAAAQTTPTANVQTATDAIVEALQLINTRNITRAQVLAALPKWMTVLWPYIQDLPLNSLWLPGTHDTLTYDLSSTATGGSCGTALASLTATQVRQWAVAQSLDVVSQLNRGIRYLDIRPYYGNNNIYAQHCLLTNSPLTTYFGQIVQNWLAPLKAAGGNEVLILHFKDFTGTWTDTSYDMLFNQLNSVFKGYIQTIVEPNSSLSVIVGGGEPGPKVLLVMQTPDNEEAFGLPSSEIAIDYDRFMWRPWPNVNTVPALLQAGTNNLNKRPDDVVMVVEGVITPTAVDVTANLAPSGFASTLSLLLHWEQGKQNLTNRLLPYMYANWLNDQGAVVMLDNPHPQDTVAIIGANFVQARRFTPRAFSYGTCSSNYKLTSGCSANWSQCLTGYKPAYSLALKASCLCSCCRGGKKGDCGFGTAQYYWG